MQTSKAKSALLGHSEIRSDKEQIILALAQVPSVQSSVSAGKFDASFTKGDKLDGSHWSYLDRYSGGSDSCDLKSC